LTEAKHKHTKLCLDLKSRVYVTQTNSVASASEWFILKP